MSSLSNLLERLSSISNRASCSPLDFISWLPPQLAFLSDPSKKKLFRAGNQAYGKTTACLAEVYWRCVGRHPYLKVKKPPIEFYIICVSWAQSVAIQMKFYNLIDKDDLDPKQREPDQKNGFGDKNPIVKFKCGSVVRFRTTHQGAINLAGATIDGALIDEPTDPRTYSELAKRVMRRNGVLLLGMTPINAPEPLDWLQELVAAGEISETWAPLEAKNLIPVGEKYPLCLEDGTPMDQKWIDEIIKGTLSYEVPVVVHGEWETRVQGRLFTAFAHDKHVVSVAPTGNYKITLGIDYGSADREWAQVVTLCIVDDSGEFPCVLVYDEWVSSGSTTIEDVADAVVDMLTRNNIKWRDLECAIGDIPIMAEKKGSYVKSNYQLMNLLAKRLKIPSSKLYPRILSAKQGVRQGPHMVEAGYRFLHENMVRPGHFYVHKRCEHVIESFERFDRNPKSKYKDPIDGVRYALKNWIFKRVSFDSSGGSLRITKPGQTKRGPNDK